MSCVNERLILCQGMPEIYSVIEINVSCENIVFAKLNLGIPEIPLGKHKKIKLVSIGKIIAAVSI